MKLSMDIETTLVSMKEDLEAKSMDTINTYKQDALKLYEGLIILEALCKYGDMLSGLARDYSFREILASIMSVASILLRMRCQDQIFDDCLKITTVIITSIIDKNPIHALKV
jgi:hypothetical protein